MKDAFVRLQIERISDDIRRRTQKVKFINVLRATKRTDGATVFYVTRYVAADKQMRDHLLHQHLRDLLEFHRHREVQYHQV